MPTTPAPITISSCGRLVCGGSSCPNVARIDQPDPPVAERRGKFRRLLAGQNIEGSRRANMQHL
jgi:hypothetical protein